MEAIRRREDVALVTASKAEVALQVAEDRLAELVASQQSTIDAARSTLGLAYRHVVKAFGSRSRAAEYLEITVTQLRLAIAAAPDPVGDTALAADADVEAS